MRWFTHAQLSNVPRGRVIFSSDRYAPTEGSDERKREGKKSGNATEYLREEMNLRFQLSSKDGRRKMPALSEIQQASLRTVKQAQPRLAAMQNQSAVRVRNWNFKPVTRVSNKRSPGIVDHSFLLLRAPFYCTVCTVYITGKLFFSGSLLFL